MLETAIIGKLSNINPLDQPEVEQIKNNHKKNTKLKVFQNYF